MRGGYDEEIQSETEVRLFFFSLQLLTFPRTVSRSVTPLKVAELQLWEERLLLTVRSMSASGVVTVLARPSTAAFSSYSFLMISSCRASRALTAGSTSPFLEETRDKRQPLRWAETMNEKTGYVSQNYLSTIQFYHISVSRC